ncbi:MAG: zinc carboxypeptidase, partial [Ramlibacter sp.]
RQLFSRHGIFNPLIAHRQQRVLRGHLPLLDFVTRAAASCKGWLPQGEEEGAAHHQAALARWYAGAA